MLIFPLEELQRLFCCFPRLTSFLSSFQGRYLCISDGLQYLHQSTAVPEKGQDAATSCVSAARPACGNQMAPPGWALLLRVWGEPSTACRTHNLFSTVSFRAQTDLTQCSAHSCNWSFTFWDAFFPASWHSLPSFVATRGHNAVTLAMPPRWGVRPPHPVGQAVLG